MQELIIVVSSLDLQNWWLSFGRNARCWPVQYVIVSNERSWQGAVVRRGGCFCSSERSPVLEKHKKVEQCWMT